MSEYLEHFDAIFPAYLSSKLQSGGIYYYAWSEQNITTTGAFTTAASGRSGTTTNSPALELNNQSVDTGVFVWMRFRACIAGQPIYEFSSASGCSCTLEDLLTGGVYDFTCHNLENCGNITVCDNKSVDFCNAGSLSLPGERECDDCDECGVEIIADIIEEFADEFNGDDSCVIHAELSCISGDGSTLDHQRIVTFPAGATDDNLQRGSMAVGTDSRGFQQLVTYDNNGYMDSCFLQSNSGVETGITWREQASVVLMGQVFGQ